MLELKLIELRTQHNLTQAQLAKKLNVNTKTIKNWEAGTSKPNADNLRDIAVFYKVTSDYLLGIQTDYSVSLSMLDENERIHIVAALQAYIDSCIKNRKE